MPYKTFRLLLWIGIPVGFVMLKLNDWTDQQYPLLWFGLSMVVVMPLICYCIYKSDDWLLEEAEEIKRERANRH